MTQEPIADRLKSLRVRANLSMKELARLLGYSGASSYQNYENPDKFTKPYLPRHLVDKLANALVGKGSPSITASEVYDLGGISPPDEFGRPVAQGLPLMGDVRAGAWLEVDELNNAIEPKRIPVIPDDRYAGVHQFVVKVVGDSMNKVFPEGLYLICASLNGIGRLPKNGEYIIAKRSQHGLEEVTVKKYVVVGNTVELHPESSNPAHLPIAFDNVHGDTDIAMIGLVIGEYKRL